MMTLALITAILMLGICGMVLLGNRRIASLNDIPPQVNKPAPLVSIVIAARNEERHIEEALQSVLKLTYEPLEIIVVNDRSIDQTGRILSRMAAEHRSLQLVHIDQLPEGWLGKNYALYQGAQRARGDSILFADADVLMEPTAIHRAVRYMQDHHVDHLAAIPRLTLPGILLNMCTAGFMVSFFVYVRPWAVQNPRSPTFIGVGAFNLIRASTYRAIGMHVPIAMRPDDDYMLGKLVKKNGFSQHAIFAMEYLSVEWYHSLGEMIEGLMKNTFAGFQYHLSWVLVATLGAMLFVLWPYAALFWTHGVVWTLNLISVLSMQVLLWDSGGFLKYRRWYGLGLPFATVIGLYIVWKATLLTLIHRGIRWRGTFYPLSALRANKI